MIVLISSCTCGSSDDDSSSDDESPSDDSSVDDTNDDTTAFDDTVADDTAVDDTADDSADDSDDDTAATTTTSTTAPSTTTTTVPSTTTTTTSTCYEDIDVAAFVEPTTAAVGESISFIALPGQFGTGVDWDLGDGGSSADWEFQHSYAAAGDYNVLVTVAGSEDSPCTFDEEFSFTVHIEEAADDTADDDTVTFVDPEFTFVGGGDAVPGKVAVDTSGTTYLFLSRADLVTYYTSTDGETWDYHLSARGVQPRAGAGTDGVIRVAYIDPAGQGTVVYSDNSSGSFVPQTLDNNGREVSLNYFDMAVDAGGHTHIVFNDLTLDRLRYATDASGSWVISTMTFPSASVGEFSIAVDNGGYVHLICFISGSLTHITNQGGRWDSDTVPFTIPGYKPNVAVDENGSLHISIAVGSLPVESRSIYYVTNQSGSWTNQVICSYITGYESGCFRPNDIEVDDNDTVHILYSYFITSSLEPPVYNAYLRHVSFPIGTTSLTTESLAHNSDTLEDDFLYTLSRTADREVHAAYKIQGTAPFGLYHKQVGSEAEHVDDLAYGAAGTICNAAGNDGSNRFSFTGTKGFYYAMELGGVLSTGYMGHSYFTQWGAGIHYSGGVGGSHQIEIDDSNVAHIVSGAFGAYSDFLQVTKTARIYHVIIDGDDRETLAVAESYYSCTSCEYTPAVAFTALGDGSINAVYNLDDGAGYHYYDSVDSEQINTSDPISSAIAIDASGYAHVAYIPNSSSVLRYTTNLTGSWEFDDVTPGLTGWSVVTMAPDPDDHIRLLFSTNTSPESLYYADNVSGSWFVEKVADYATCHRHGIAVDSSGVVHIAYFDTTDAQIRYAYNDGSGWNHYIVDEGSGQAGLALDEDAGTVRIGYEKWEGLWAAEFPMP